MSSSSSASSVRSNKTLLYAAAASTAVIATSIGAYYYYSHHKGYSSGVKPNDDKQQQQHHKKSSKKARREHKKKDKSNDEIGGKQTMSESTKNDELAPVNETLIQSLDKDQRKDLSLKYKNAGNTAFGKKKYDEGIELYTQALLLHQDPVYYSNRAACHYAKSEYDAVLSDTDEALKLDPNYSRALARRAASLEKLARYDEAAVDFTASCILDEFGNRANSDSVDRVLRLGAEKEADVFCNRRDKKLPSKTYMRTYLNSFHLPQPSIVDDDEEGSGDWYLKKGLEIVNDENPTSYEEAFDAFKKAVELNAKHLSVALAFTALFKFLINDDDASMQDLNRSISIKPSGFGYVVRATFYLENGDIESSMNDFANGLNQDPKNPDTYYHRAQVSFIMGKYDEALTDYNETIKLDGDCLLAYIQRAVAQYKMGKVELAMQSFQKLLDNVKFKNCADAHNYRGELLMDQGKFSEAIKEFNNAMELEVKAHPNAPNVLPLVNKALTVCQRDSTEIQRTSKAPIEAINLLKKALEIDPMCDIAAATLAQILLQEGKINQAMKYLEMRKELVRTKQELVQSLIYILAGKTQLKIQDKYPQFAAKLAQQSAANANV